MPRAARHVLRCPDLLRAVADSASRPCRPHRGTQLSLCTGRIPLLCPRRLYKPAGRALVSSPAHLLFFFLSPHLVLAIAAAPFKLQPAVALRSACTRLAPCAHWPAPPPPRHRLFSSLRSQRRWRRPLKTAPKLPRSLLRIPPPSPRGLLQISPGQPARAGRGPRPPLPPSLPSSAPAE